jgi:hypothetical protein
MHNQIFSKTGKPRRPGPQLISDFQALPRAGFFPQAVRSAGQALLPARRPAPTGDPAPPGGHAMAGRKILFKKSAFRAKNSSMNRLGC